jgi:polyphenol oxidase
MNAMVHGRVSIQGITAVALNRSGGVSKPPFDSLNLASYVGDDEHCVSENIERVRNLLKADNVCLMNAEHGNVVHRVSKPGIAAPGDGLVTTTPNLALLALAADCVPFGLIDPINGVIGVGHAGWRGVLANVMQSLLDEFVNSGARLEHTQAVIGPAICAKCYEVPAERVEQFQDAHPAAIASKRNLDLTAGVKSVLATQVMKIHEIAGCTLESSELFSYRRGAGEPTGRGGLVVAIGTS